MRITIVGAGVSGLTCGVTLAERGHEVTIVAAEIGITSRAAGAVWFPYDCLPEESVVAWSLTTYGRLCELARDPASHVSMTEFRCLDLPLPGWAIPLGGRELDGGFAVDVPLIETPGYLDFLRARFRGELRLGAQLQSLDEVDGDAIVNCSGIGARQLAHDADLHAHRGQLVVVDKLDLPGTLVHETDVAYAIPRTNDCLLGGTNDERDDLTPDAAQTADIIERCHRLLGTPANPRIRDVRVGLRPFRATGIRLESERLADGRVAVHNYGHGGSGFTVSWGCAEEVARLLPMPSRRA